MCKSNRFLETLGGQYARCLSVADHNIPRVKAANRKRICTDFFVFGGIRSDRFEYALRNAVAHEKNAFVVGTLARFFSKGANRSCIGHEPFTLRSVAGTSHKSIARCSEFIEFSSPTTAVVRPSRWTRGGRISRQRETPKSGFRDPAIAGEKFCPPVDSLNLES